MGSILECDFQAFIQSVCFSQNLQDHTVWGCPALEKRYCFSQAARRAGHCCCLNVATHLCCRLCNGQHCPERLQSEVLCSWVCIVLMPCMFYHGIVPILLYDPTFLLCPVWNDHCSILFPNRLAVQVGKRCLGRSLVNHKEQLVSHKEYLVVWFSERLLFLMKLLTSAARISASSPPTAQIIPEQEPSAQQRLVG